MILTVLARTGAVFYVVMSSCTVSHRGDDEQRHATGEARGSEQGTVRGAELASASGDGKRCEKSFDEVIH